MFGGMLKTLYDGRCRRGLNREGGGAGCELKLTVDFVFVFDSSSTATVLFKDMEFR